MHGDYGNLKISKKIDMSRLPKHVAFIMDGNRRWAEAKGLAKSLGHSAGYNSMLKAVKRCVDIGVGVISFFAWSSENWGREKSEVDDVMGLARQKADEDIKKIMEYGIRITTMGDTSRFPKDLQEKLKKVTEMSKNNTRGTLNLCIGYGGRADIVQAVNQIKDKGNVTEESFEKYLYGADLPDIDFVVRTSGEQRISNFMLWKMAYSELYFPKIFWPTVDEKFIDKCIIEYQKRNRRYGKS
jgi:undecaprenyl diphosphate synthase